MDNGSVSNVNIQEVAGHDRSRQIVRWSSSQKEKSLRWRIENRESTTCGSELSSCTSVRRKNTLEV